MQRKEKNVSIVTTGIILLVNFVIVFCLIGKPVDFNALNAELSAQVDAVKQNQDGSLPAFKYDDAKYNISVEYINAKQSYWKLNVSKKDKATMNQQVTVTTNNYKKAFKFNTEAEYILKYVFIILALSCIVLPIVEMVVIVLLFILINLICFGIEDLVTKIRKIAYKKTLSL